MKATPIQRYALRLVLAANPDFILSPEQWKKLQRKDAEKILASFGGLEHVIRDTVLPTRSVPRTEPGNAAPERADLPVPQRNSELER